MKTFTDKPIVDRLSLNKKLYVLRKTLNNFQFKNPLVKQIVNTREVDDLKDFLSKSIRRYWPKLEDIPNLEVTIDFLYEAKSQGKTLGIVGDYDVDGICATSLLIKCFGIMDITYVYQIPNRFEGYGVSLPIVKDLISKGAQAIITVDNGTTAYDVIEFLNQAYIPMIIIDHHKLQDPIDVKYFVNPHLFDNDYKILCATSLVFIVLSEFNKKYNLGVSMKDFVDLVGLATVCDVVPLVKFNRVMLNYSLEKIRKEPMDFIVKLLGENYREIGVRQLGFIVGPHINAPGRFGRPELALDFIVNSCTKEMLAEILIMNHNRRSLERKIVDECMANVDSKKNYILLYNEIWHEGLIGIIAGRLKERFLKPAMVFTRSGEFVKGSFRSIDTWDVGSFIREAKKEGLIYVGGGHSKAGGATVALDKFQEFQVFLDNYINYIEKPLEPVDSINSLQMIKNYPRKEIEELGPFGEGNPVPLFFFANCLVSYYEIVNENDCLLFLTNFSQTLRPIVVRIFDIFNSPFKDLMKHNLSVHIIGSIERGFLQIKDAIIL